MNAFARTTGRTARNLSLYSMATVFLSGCCLAWYYIPVPDRAFTAIAHLKESIFAGGIVLSVHTLSGAIFLCAVLALIVSLLADTMEYRMKPALFVVSASLFVIGTAGMITGLILAQNEQAVPIFQRLFLPSYCRESTLPRLFDASSLAFFRVFLIHAACIPAAAAGLLYLVLKIGKPVFDHGNRNPIIKHSAFFAAYTTVLIIVAYYLKSMFLNR